MFPGHVFMDASARDAYMPPSCQVPLAWQVAAAKVTQGESQTKQWPIVDVVKTVDGSLAYRELCELKIVGNSSGIFLVENWRSRPFNSPTAWGLLDNEQTHYMQRKRSTVRISNGQCWSLIDACQLLVGVPPSCIQPLGSLPVPPWDDLLASIPVPCIRETWGLMIEAGSVGLLLQPARPWSGAGRQASGSCHWPITIYRRSDDDSPQPARVQTPNLQFLDRWFKPVGADCYEQAPSSPRSVTLSPQRKSALPTYLSPGPRSSPCDGSPPLSGDTSFMAMGSAHHNFAGQPSMVVPPMPQERSRSPPRFP